MSIVIIPAPGAAITGTPGGIPYFKAGGVEDTSTFLTAHAIMLGGSSTTFPMPAGLIGWWDASAIIGLSNGSSLTTWSDLSGNGYNLTAPLGHEPTYNTNVQNGLPVATFTTSPLCTMSTPTISLDEPCSILLVASSAIPVSGSADLTDSGTTNTRVIYLIPSAIGLYAGVVGPTTAYTPGQVAIVEGIFDGTSSVVGVNGTVATGTTSVSTATGFTLGGPAGMTTLYLIEGIVCEVLVFNSHLGTSVRQSVEGYLAWKWGLQGLLPGGHPWASTSPISPSYSSPYTLGGVGTAGQVLTSQGPGADPQWV